MKLANDFKDIEYDDSSGYWMRAVSDNLPSFHVSNHPNSGLLLDMTYRVVHPLFIKSGTYIVFNYDYFILVMSSI